MISFRYLVATVIAAWVLPLAGREAPSAYIGSSACRDCHATQFQSQSKTAHARALRKADRADPGPGSKAEWAFGAGAKAITWVSQTGDDTIAEHGLSFYTATKSLAITPGHKTSADTVYRTFDPVATALRCFRCHSTGPLTLAANYRVQPSEPGVRCESCHGPGRAHAEAGGAAAIQNPKRLNAVQISGLCGSCHRHASDLDDDRDWTNAWNVRHQPAYLHRAACFRNSDGALSCLTCHDPHQPLKTASASYDARCIECHQKTTHARPVTASCVSCHMPQVTTTPNLKFTNHWIGIYDLAGKRLIPSKRAAKELRPAPAAEASAAAIVVPADPSTLASLYEKALAERERESGPGSAKVARAASDLGAFLLQVEKNADAEAPLRRAMSIDERNQNPAIDADRETLAASLMAQGRANEATELYRRAAEGRSPQVAARSFAKLAELDPGNAERHFQNAVAAEEKASGAGSPRVAVLLHQYALALRARKSDPEAEPLLRRALTIQQSAPKADVRVTIGVMNTLGNLLQGRGQLDEAEKLVRAALTLAEQKFGPESVQLAVTCTYLADILWSKKDLRGAGLLYRRAIGIDAALYGPEQPQTAADIANLGMLMTEAGQSAAGTGLLRQALQIYEQTLGPASAEAQFVRQRLK